MNILSLLSFAVFICYFILALYSIKQGIHRNIHVLALLTCLSLSVWAFCYTFIYQAPTADAAFLWHKLAALGWSLFPAFVCHLLLILTNDDYFLQKKWQLFLFYALPTIILLKNCFAGTTCVALSFVPSLTDLGWAYHNTAANLWTWIYVLYLVSYIGGALFSVNRWQRQSTYANVKKQGSFYVVVIALLLITGQFTDIILPLFAPFLPPLSNILIILFVIGFFFLADRYQMFTFSNIASSDIILNTIMDPILVLDENHQILKTNQAVHTILGYPENELSGQTIHMLFSDKQKSDSLFHAIAANKKLKNYEIDLLTATNNVINTTLSAAVLESGESGFNGIVVTFHDITMRKKTADALFKSKEKHRRKADDLFVLANYDVLTQLPNRRYFFNKLGEFQALYHHSNDDFAVIFMDLNGFKGVNDEFGHDIGDLVLIESARRLEQAKTGTEFLSRIGGDEFTLIIPNVKSETAVSRRIAEIKTAFNQPFKLTALNTNLSISAGYALFSTSKDNIDILVHHADLKMYEDKRCEQEADDRLSN